MGEQGDTHWRASCSARWQSSALSVLIITVIFIMNSFPIAWGHSASLCYTEGRLFCCRNSDPSGVKEGISWLPCPGALPWLLQGCRCSRATWSSTLLSSRPQGHSTSGESGGGASPQRSIRTQAPGWFPVSTAVCPPEPFSHLNAHFGLSLDFLSLVPFSFSIQMTSAHRTSA